MSDSKSNPPSVDQVTIESVYSIDGQYIKTLFYAALGLAAPITSKSLTP